MKNIIIISATSGNNLILAKRIGELVELKSKINLNVDFISKPAKLKLEKAGVTINLKQKI